MPSRGSFRRARSQFARISSCRSAAHCLDELQRPGLQASGQYISGCGSPETGGAHLDVTVVGFTAPPGGDSNVPSRLDADPPAARPGQCARRLCSRPPAGPEANRASDDRCRTDDATDAEGWSEQPAWQAYRVEDNGSVELDVGVNGHARLVPGKAAEAPAHTVTASSRPGLRSSSATSVQVSIVSYRSHQGTPIVRFASC
jgi:hypothetical protein